MESPQLDMFEGAVDWPDWFRPGKNTPASHKANVSQGRHPLGLPLLNAEGWERCGNCQHLAVSSNHSVRYFKCGRMPNTRGSATDIRKKWAACVRWEDRRAHRLVEGI